MNNPTYRASERYPFLAGTVTVLALVAMALVVTFMLSSVQQLRSEMRSQADHSDATRARMIQVGALR